MSTYFQGLNYSLANEDTWVEHDLLPQNPGSVFTVCGSGSRVLPLLARHPSEVHVVDLSDTQLRLCRLRLSAAKNLGREDFLYLLGYKPDSTSRKTRPELMTRLTLSEEDNTFWKAQEKFWAPAGFIFLGKWERHFMMMGRIFQRIPFIDVRPLFEARNLEEQRRLLPKHWHPKLFQVYTKVVLNEWVSNKLLYKGHFAGSAKARTMEMSAAEFVFSQFDDLFRKTWVRSNYFLNMIFLNEVKHPECWPAETDENVLVNVRKADPKMTYHQRNLLELLNERPHDFYSLSDTFSYMKDEEVGSFLSRLPVGIKPGTQMVIRTFMRRPRFEISSPWRTDEVKNKELARKDCTRVYEFNWLVKS